MRRAFTFTTILLVALALPALISAPSVFSQTPSGAPVPAEFQSLYTRPDPAGNSFWQPLDEKILDALVKLAHYWTTRAPAGFPRISG